MAMSEPLAEEWERRATPYARRWRSAMARRGRVRWVVPTRAAELTEEIDRCAETPNGAAAMHRDVHLPDAALAADGWVVTEDSTVRDLFVALQECAPVLERVRWLIPSEGALPLGRR